MLSFLVTCLFLGQSEPTCTTRIQVEESKVTGKFWAKNSGKVPFNLRITDCRYNYFKTDLKLPYEVELGPGKSISLNVRPIDLQAQKYGKHVKIDYAIIRNTKVVSTKSDEANRDDNPPKIFGSANLSGRSIKGYEISLHNEMSVPTVQMKDLSISYAGKPLKFELYPKVYNTPAIFVRAFGAKSVSPLKLPSGIIELPPGTLYVIAKVPSLDGVKSSAVFKWRRGPAAPWRNYNQPFTSNRSVLMDRIK